MLVSLALAFYIYLPRTSDNEESYKTAHVQKADIRVSISAAGIVKPKVEVEVKSKAGGEIMDFPFEEGDLLEKGAIVVRLDPETENLRVNQAKAGTEAGEATLEKARVSLKDMEIRLKRKERLFNEGIISNQELDEAMVASEKAALDVRIAEAELAKAKEALNEAEDRLADTMIKAPIRGQLLKKYVETGQVISSTLSSASEGTLLFTMADLKNIFVAAMVDEVDIARIETGQKTLVTVDSLKGVVFEGHVARVAPKGRVERTVTVFDVYIEVTDAERSRLKPEMSADVEIILAMGKNLLVVPSEAIRIKDDKKWALVVINKEPTWREIKTGLTDGVITEVTHGLEQGEEVIVSKEEKKMDKKKQRLY
ncbi:MAG: efflux RND transporter periplasmic adaptor subunit [Deltaproteobacteria bacterium]|nr:efflux RND transporter periplasmic adaptor subunit [Deltaproteobacteria bacterium]